MASADVPSQPIVRGWSGICAPVDGLNGAFIQGLRPRSAGA